MGLFSQRRRQQCGKRFAVVTWSLNQFVCCIKYQVSLFNHSALSLVYIRIWATWLQPILVKRILIDSLGSTYSNMHQYNLPALVKIMVCRLPGAKPLSEPMLPYSQLDPKKHISVKFYLGFNSFHSMKYTWIWRLPKWRPSCPGFNLLSEMQ